MTRVFPPVDSAFVVDVYSEMALTGVGRTRPIEILFDKVEVRSTPPGVWTWANPSGTLPVSLILQAAVGERWDSGVPVRHRKHCVLSSSVERFATRL